MQPGQQVWLNLGALLHNQVPDSDGKTIPPDVMFGSYELRDLDHNFPDSGAYSQVVERLGQRPDLTSVGTLISLRQKSVLTLFGSRQ